MLALNIQICMFIQNTHRGQENSKGTIEKEALKGGEIEYIGIKN